MENQVNISPQPPFWAENLHIAGAVIGPDHRIRHANRALRSLLACDSEELVGRRCCEVFCTPAVNDPCTQAEDFPSCFSRPQNVFLPSGSRDEELVFRCSASALGGSDVFVVCEDISERRGFKELNHREQFESLVAKISRSLIMASDEEFDSVMNQILSGLGEFMEADRCYLFRYDPATESFSNTHEWCSPEISPEIADLQSIATSALPWFWRQMEAIRPVSISDVAHLPDQAGKEQELWERGGIKSLLVVPVLDGTGLSGFLGLDMVRTARSWNRSDTFLFQTVAESIGGAIARQKRDFALEACKMRFSTMADAAPVLIWCAQMSGALSYGNQVWCNYTGLPPDKVCLSWRNMVHSDDLREFESQYLKAAEKGLQFNTEARLRRHDGAYRWMQFSGAPVSEVDGERGVIGSAHDITDYKMIEEQLMSMNESLEQRVMERTREVQVAYDELKSTQSQLLQQEKMASIGQLAAGVAHEINNPIGFVTSNLTTLRKYFQRMQDFLEVQQSALKSATDASEELQRRRKALKLDYILDDTHQLIEESLEGTERVKKIVQDLKGFARLDEVTFKPADINQCLESTINIVWNEIKYKVTLEKEFGDLPLLPCYPQQLNQVFLNLLVNAAQAIERQGIIRVSTRQEGEWVLVEVSDTGFGIEAEIVSRIFEPFFTTKEVGKGTGLGLSISYDIVKKHGGEIIVESRVGEGSTFTIRLPLENIPPDIPS